MTKFFILTVLTLVFLGQAAEASRKMKPDTTWAMKELKEKGFKKAYLNTLKKHYDKKSYETVLRLNLLGFLAPPNHMTLVSSKAVDKSVRFLEKNKKTFNSSAKSYDVPPEVIASLLWVETRHGGITGDFHVPSVYLHLLQADREKTRNQLFKIARKNPYSQKYTDEELRKKIQEKAQWRSQWALEQLTALEKMYTEKQKNISKLKGSHSGAFGVPQFIPSSYRSFAVSAKSKKTPDLFKPADAVHSVAKYLMVHGWDNNDPEAQLNALMKYNNSRDYAESILDLSVKVKKRIQEKQDRAVAQKNGD